MDESAAQMRVNMIAQMETNYAANHPDTGYVCTFGTLYATAEAEPNGFASLSKEESNGYLFSLTGCSGLANAIDPVGLAKCQFFGALRSLHNGLDQRDAQLPFLEFHDRINCAA